MNKETFTEAEVKELADTVRQLCFIYRNASVIVGGVVRKANDLSAYLRLGEVTKQVVAVERLVYVDKPPTSKDAESAPL